jgi:hypothetical protein
VFAAFVTPMKERALPAAGTVFVLNGIAASIPATLVLFFIEDVVKRPDLTAVFPSRTSPQARGYRAGWLARKARQAPRLAGGHGSSIAAFVGVLARDGDMAACRHLRAVGAGLGADLAYRRRPGRRDRRRREERQGRSEGAYFGPGTSPPS